MGRTRQVVSLRVLAATGGVLAGVGGVVHGVGEVLQGTGRPDGIYVESWTTGRIASNLGGEPALTLVPDLLLSGLLTLASSAALAWWSATSTEHRYGGRVMAGLSGLLLLVGGGVGPPTIGLLSALVAGVANRAPGRRSRGAGAALAGAWPTLFWLCVADYVFLVFGSLFVGVVLDVDLSSAFVTGLMLTLVLTPLATLAGAAHGAAPAATRRRLVPGR
jgi:hypothetical protein